MSEDAKAPKPASDLRWERRRQARKLRAARAEGLLRGVLSQLRPGDLVVDCGANVGRVTLPLAETGAQVHAFEPDPLAYAKLQDAVAGRENVALYQAAVGVAAGRAKLMRGEGHPDDPLTASVRATIVPGGNRIDADPDAAIEVEVVALPDMLADWIAASKRIAFLKIDIEGAELELLRALLDRRLFDGIALTLAETHGYKFPALREDFQDLRRAVAAAYPKSRVDLDWV